MTPSKTAPDYRIVEDPPKRLPRQARHDPAHTIRPLPQAPEVQTTADRFRLLHDLGPPPRGRLESTGTTRGATGRSFYGPAPLVVMVQFYFDVREDDAFVPDVEGEALPSVDAAIAQAVDIATLIAREHLPERKSQTIVVEVRDEHGARVLTTTMSLKIEPVKAYVMPGPKGGA